MEIQSALSGIFREVRRYDSHIPSPWLEDCIGIYVLRDAGNTVGILRYKLFWKTIPFLDLLFPEEAHRGPEVWPMARWEAEMAKEGHSYVMLSTQEDETAKFFYGILGYQPIGAFLPLELEARVLLYEKSVPLR